MAMKWVEKIPIEINGTILMIGALERLYVPSESLDPDGAIDLERCRTAGISGLNSYYKLSRVAKYPYARVGQKPQNIL